MFPTLRKCLFLLDRSMRLHWLILIALAVMAAMLEMSGTAVIFGLINLVDNPANVGKLPFVGSYLASIVDLYGAQTVIVLGLAAAFYFVAKNGFLLFQIYYSERCAGNAAAAAGTRLMRAYLDAPYSFHFLRNSAETIRDLEKSVDVVFNNVLLSTISALSEFLVALGVAFVLLSVEPFVTLASAVAITLMSTAILFLIRKKSVDLGVHITQVAGAIIRAVQQGLGSIKESKILGCESFFLDRFQKGREQRAHLIRQYATINAAPRLAMESVMVIGMVLTIVLLISREGRETSVLPVIGLFAYAGFRIVPSANRIVMHVNNIRFGKAAVDSVYGGLRAAEAAALVGTSHPRGILPAAAEISYANEVRLDGVAYRYPGAHRDALTAATLAIPRGATVGIVGVTGAGKTTLVDVLIGLLRPTQGRLLVDGHDITDDPRIWQRKIGYVPQTIYLTDDTIAANIALGVTPSEIDGARLRRAAGMAQILEFIESLPSGFDTFVGERGIRLSGGQRQRIGIARALYRDPELLIFDEATSALDNETETELSRAIARLSGVKTIVLIAHRFSTLHSCKTLVMMKDGRIVAEGDYDHLLRVSEDFRRLAALADRAATMAPRSDILGAEAVGQ